MNPGKMTLPEASTRSRAATSIPVGRTAAIRPPKINTEAGRICRVKTSTIIPFTMTRSPGASPRATRKNSGSVRAIMKSTLRLKCPCLNLDHFEAGGESADLVLGFPSTPPNAACLGVMPLGTRASPVAIASLIKSSTILSAATFPSALVTAT